MQNFIQRRKQAVKVGFALYIHRYSFKFPVSSFKSEQQNVCLGTQFINLWARCPHDSRRDARPPFQISFIKLALLDGTQLTTSNPKLATRNFSYPASINPYPPPQPLPS